MNHNQQELNITLLEARLERAKKAAKIVGLYLREQFYKPERLVDEALAHDMKLRVDKEAQARIEFELLSTYPNDSFLGEEGARQGQDSDYLWIVDPLDGTVNYFYGIPIFCVSIALQYRGEIVLGCVYDPMQDEMYSAVRGGEALLNGRLLRVSSRETMAEAVIFAGHGCHDNSGQVGIARFAHLSSQVRKMRILGSAALSICYIAAGRFDAYIEQRIFIWDFAAAKLILNCAGGKLDFVAHDEQGMTGSVVVWNARLPIYEAMRL